MILLQCLFVLIGALCCYAAPASDSDIPPGHCGQPPRFEFKELTGVWNKQYYLPGTRASYTCSPGFIRQGVTNFVCTEGKWESIGSPGVCRKRSCGHPGDIDFGSFELRNEEQFVFGAIVEYTCDEGYQMVSRYRTRECTATGWTNRPPICEVRQCSTVVADNNVDILYTSQDEEHTVGQVVRFECKNADQTINGPSEIFCTSEGQWSGNPPTCKETVCGLPVIGHGKPKIGSAKSFKVKQTIDYECNTGYKPFITPQTTCTASGWSPVPMCEEIFCNLENVAKGRIIDPKSSYRYGETVKLECSKDYQPEGNPDEDRKCTSYGWSPPLKCVSQQCFRPEIKNGFILSGRYNHYYYRTHFPMDVGDYFYYTCNKGFSPPSRYWYGTSYCRREGWRPQPTCSKPCSVPYSDEMNANIYDSRTHFYEGNKIQFYCKSGYQTQNGKTSGEIECLSNGRFTEEKCFKHCPIPKIDYGFINTNKTKFEVRDIVMFTCKEGFNTEKNLIKDIIECTNNGWVPKSYCKEISCKISNTIYKSGDIVHFKCPEGTQLEGQNSSQCYYYGWGPKVPVCRDMEYNEDFPPLIEKDNIPESKCPPASAPPKADVRYLNDNEEEAEIVCNSGYTLDGPAKISCQDGKWQSPPMCILLKPCPPPPPIDNGEIIEKMYSYGSTIQYSCKEGYHKSSDSDKIICLNGRWTESPTCKENFCGNPEDIENGKVIGVRSVYQPGERATFECSEGYTLSGNAATCSKGKWVDIPTCIDTTCEKPPTISNGKALEKVQEKYFTGQRVEYQCNPGYSLKDNMNYVTCKDSQWTEAPQCRRSGLSCNAPPSVNFGDLTEIKKLSYPSGSSITFVCMQLHTLEGNEKIRCRDGEWEKAPLCREPCTVRESDMKINNIRLKYKDDKKLYSKHFDNMTFECLPGYGISNETLLRIQCLDGKLNYPKCFRRGFCVLKRSEMDSNNILYGNSDIVEKGKNITFECADGMIPENSLEAKCNNEQIDYPKCIASRPCSAPEIENVKIDPEKEKYNSGFSADINCQEPYVIDGPRSIKCNNGQWSALPQCLGACTVNTNNLNENKLELESEEDLSRTLRHDEEVKVKCKVNSKRPGSPTAVCNNGKMKYDKCFPPGPVCRIDQEKIDFNALVLDEIHNTDMYYGENETVYFKCKDGSKSLTGRCSKPEKSKDLELTYPNCSKTAAAAASL